MKIFHHTGDLGDIVASFPVIRELGGGKYVISDAKFSRGHGPRESMRGKRFEALQPIFQATDYITEIEWQDNPTGVTHDVASFRSLQWRAKETLTRWQGRFFKLDLPEAPAPWLYTPDADKHGKIVVGRTTRYRTSFFPWKAIVEKYRDDLIFLGTHGEFLEFAGLVKIPIEYHPTANLLEATKIIAGSRLFIGNQSVLFWIAAGLGQDLIQETHDQIYTRNSIIPRDNAMYSDTNENLIKIYDTLELDKTNMKKKENLVPPTRVNLSTSACDFRKNLSTSAEIFEQVANIGIQGN